MREREPNHEFHDSERHLPIGQLGYYEVNSRPLITNALPNRMLTGFAREVHSPTGTVLSSILHGVGFNDTEDRVREGKFVFMKDGTFFLAQSSLVHTDLPMCIGSYDRVAVLSAGFCRIYPDRVTLSGRSESLDREVCMLVPYDRKAISEHLNIPFELLAEECLDD